MPEGGDCQDHGCHHQREISSNYQYQGEHILEDEHTHQRIAGSAFTDHHRQGVDLAFLIHLILVDMFAEDHPGHTQGIGQAGEHHRPAPAAGDDEVTTTDHEWSPYQQHGELTQGDIFERPGVEQDEKDTQSPGAAVSTSCGS